MSTPHSSEVPRIDDPWVQELAARYALHPTQASQWRDATLEAEPFNGRFRADGHYVRQHGTDDDYRITCEYVCAHDDLGLADFLTDDDAFGARTFEWNDRTWTRDLLDSISEINFLAEALPLSLPAGLSYLDIGAGYGRFAQRMSQAFPGSRIVCADGVPLSTAICDFYLDYRRAKGCRVLPLDRLENDTKGERFDVAISMHAFNEMPMQAIEWWLRLIGRLEVRFLFLIPNDTQGLRSCEQDGTRESFEPLIASAGYVLRSGRDKYWRDADVQHHGLYPGMYLLYELHPERAETTVR